VIVSTLTSMKGVRIEIKEDQNELQSNMYVGLIFNFNFEFICITIVSS
jgi:hypothetical protein